MNSQYLNTTIATLVRGNLTNDDVIYLSKKTDKSVYLSLIQLAIASKNMVNLDMLVSSPLNRDMLNINLEQIISMCCMYGSRKVLEYAIEVWLINPSTVSTVQRVYLKDIQKYISMNANSSDQEELKSYFARGKCNSDDYLEYTDKHLIIANGMDGSIRTVLQNYVFDTDSDDDDYA